MGIKGIVTWISGVPFLFSSLLCDLKNQLSLRSAHFKILCKINTIHWPRITADTSSAQDFTLLGHPFPTL